MSEFFKEDLPRGDKTTENIVPDITQITAEIQALEELVFAGCDVIPHCFGKNCSVSLKKRDGENIFPGEVLSVVKGPAGKILSRERIMLNLIQRLCGIASLSRKFADIANPYHVKILDTRKTTPGLRLFEKYAVAVGGAFNHRLNLSEGILIKDNHIISSGSVSAAIKSINKTGTNLPLEVEVDNLDQIREALIVGVDGILLDNMNPEKIRKAVQLIRKHKNGNEIFIEASGNITCENISGYLETWVNAVSIGALTHSAISKDIRLDFIN